MIPSGALRRTGGQSLAHVRMNSTHSKKLFKLSNANGHPVPPSNIAYPRDKHLDAFHQSVTHVAFKSQQRSTPVRVSHRDVERWSLQFDPLFSYSPKHADADYTLELRSIGKPSKHSRFQSILKGGFDIRSRIEKLVNRVPAVGNDLPTFQEELNFLLFNYYSKFIRRKEWVGNEVKDKLNIKRINENTREDILELTSELIVSNHLSDLSAILTRRKEILKDMATNDTYEISSLAEFKERYIKLSFPGRINHIAPEFLTSLLASISQNPLPHAHDPKMVTLITTLYQDMLIEKFPLSTLDTYNWLFLTEPIYRLGLFEKLCSNDEIKIESEHVILALESYSGDLAHVFELMDTHSIDMSRKLCVLLLNHYIETGNLESFLNVFQIMIESYNYAMDAKLATVLITGFQKFDFPEVTDYLKDVIKLSIDTETNTPIDALDLQIYDFLRLPKSTSACIQFKFPAC